MNPELHDLLHRWHIGTLNEDGLRRLNELIDTPEARAAVHDEWFLDATLPEALLALPAWNVPQPDLLSRSAHRRLSSAQWTALGAAAAVTIACLVWERSGFPLERPEAFAAQVAAASLEP